MKKVYVAGKLNDMAVGYIMNIHKMIKTARDLRNAGYAVYVPCNDFLEGLVDGNFDYHEYFDNSQPWLMSSDAIFLTPGWERSSGTIKEMQLAWEKEIPIFDNISELDAYFNSNDHAGKIIGLSSEPGVDEYGDHLRIYKKKVDGLDVTAVKIKHTFHGTRVKA